MIFVNKDIILLNKEYCGDVAFVMKKSPSENERYVTTCTCGTPRPEKESDKFWEEYAPKNKTSDKSPRTGYNKTSWRPTPNRLRRKEK